MNEILFFLFGLMIGGLTGITMMCMLQLSRFADSKIETPKMENEK